MDAVSTSQLTPLQPIQRPGTVSDKPISSAAARVTLHHCIEVNTTPQGASSPNIRRRVLEALNPEADQASIRRMLAAHEDKKASVTRHKIDLSLNRQLFDEFIRQCPSNDEQLEFGNHFLSHLLAHKVRTEDILYVVQHPNLKKIIDIDLLCSSPNHNPIHQLLNHLKYRTTADNIAILTALLTDFPDLQCMELRGSSEDVRLGSKTLFMHTLERLDDPSSTEVLELLFTLSPDHFTVRLRDDFIKRVEGLRQRHLGRKDKLFPTLSLLQTKQRDLKLQLKQIRKDLKASGITPEHRQTLLGQQGVLDSQLSVTRDHLQPLEFTVALADLYLEVLTKMDRLLSK